VDWLAFELTGYGKFTMRGSTDRRPSPGKTRLKESNNIWRNSNRVYSNLSAIASPPFLLRAVHIPGHQMNHSLYSADRQTHRRIIGSAFVAIVISTMFGVAAFSKLETRPAQPSVAVLRAGIPLATTDGGYIIVR
jgi:hypothetical protein